MRGVANGGRWSARARLAVAVLFLLTALPAAGPVTRADEVDTEYQIKAAFLYKFGGYVEWPETPDDARDGNFTIAVMGADLLAEYLADMVGTRRIAGRPIEVRVVREGADLTDVQVLFVGRSTYDAASTLAGLRDEPVLTVTESDDTGLEGGVINFVVVDNKVRFDIALASARQRELKISARLLEVARRVVERPS